MARVVDALCLGFRGQRKTADWTRTPSRLPDLCACAGPDSGVGLCVMPAAAIRSDARFEVGERQSRVLTGAILLSPTRRSRGHVQSAHGRPGRLVLTERVQPRAVPALPQGA